MTFELSARAAQAGHRIEAFETIGSTSEVAMARALAGDRGPLWVVAREQSAGRGRRGSTWRTPPGNLATSLMLTTDLPPARIALLGFVAGLALDRALDACCGTSRTRRVALDEARHGSERFSLKWPNDVLADGGKLAGILLGTEAVGSGRRAVVIGIGVNVAHAPDGLDYPAAALAGLGCETDAESLFAALSRSWVETYETWEQGGFPAIRTKWLARATGLGGQVVVKTSSGVTRGIFETIDESGQLVVRVPDGSARTISAGEVHFGVAASVSPERHV